MGNMGGIERLMVFGILMIIITILGIAFFSANDMDDLPDEYISDEGSSERSEPYYRDPVTGTEDDLSGASNEGLPNDLADLGGTSLSNTTPDDGYGETYGGETSVDDGAPAEVVEEAPEPKMYKVVKGDSFARIARKIYGDEKYTSAIQAANPGINPLGLQIDMEIILPDISDVKKADMKKAAASAGPSESAVAGKWYRVRKNDNLYSIAEKMLGSKKHWKKIYEANRDVLSDPDTLRAGMDIRIP